MPPEPSQPDPGAAGAAVRSLQEGGGVRPPQKIWPWVVVLVVLWLTVSLGCTWGLISQSFERTLHQQLRDRAAQIAATLRTRLPPPSATPPSTSTSPPAPPPSPAPLVADRLADHLGDRALQQQVQWEFSHEPALAYVMLWDQGLVVAHSQPELAGQTLSPALWSPLEPAQNQRLVELHGLPWTLNALADAAGEYSILRVVNRQTRVLDITIPLLPGPADSGNGGGGYVSIGVTRAWINQQFWRSQRPVLSAAVVMSLVGTLFLLLAIWYTRRQRRKASIQQEQNLRARTSLLTERGMLASILAHEVRSPLTALRFNLHSLRSLLVGRPTGGPPPAGSVEPGGVGVDSAKLDRQVMLTDLCDREIRRLDLMLSDFLTHTQVIGPAARTSVNQVVHEAIDFLKPSLEKSHIRTLLHLDDSNPLVSVNADELRQVLLNLAANAQDAMTRRHTGPADSGGSGGEGGGTLVISTVSEENSITLLVRDDGPGIPQDIQYRIFEPFFSTKAHGSGLGLALVRRVISGAGGTVFCESVLEEGTTFRIVLPRALPVSVEP